MQVHYADQDCWLLGLVAVWDGVALKSVILRRIEFVNFLMIFKNLKFMVGIMSCYEDWDFYSYEYSKNILIFQSNSYASNVSWSNIQDFFLKSNKILKSFLILNFQQLKVQTFSLNFIFELSLLNFIKSKFPTSRAFLLFNSNLFNASSNKT